VRGGELGVKRIFYHPGLLAGAVAVVQHNFGVLGNHFSEVAEDLTRTLRALGPAAGGRPHLDGAFSPPEAVSPGGARGPAFFRYTEETLVIF
jgi:hypothetical protein